MKNKTKSTILVAVADVDRASLPLLKKAATLARQRRVGLDLLHVIALPYGPVMSGGANVKAALRAAIEDGEAALARLAKIPELRGLRVRTTVRWDYPASDAIVREVLRRRPLLLLAESQRHSRLARIVLTNTDWDLIRNCPCPVWLSKGGRLAARPTVIAALDPFHLHAKPAALDAIILQHAIDTAGSPQRVFAYHAHEIPQPLAVEGVVEPYWVTLTSQQIEQFDARNRRVLERVAQRHEIPPANVTYARGNAAAQLPGYAKRRGADVVVMGAVSRTGLKRLFIGNTAERVVDALDCDVLIVKPRGFKTPVSRRAARLLPYPPYPAM